uniref:Uncharacterized protein n=1 Tax=Pyrodinium bahamense TaxID=73915 RepID=A0A7S0AP52_9DINO|mmetsp:Transcript_38696/g.107622  ORF Transcript_38696/g.107622 Transcript_38696/m.107622 type:complete len:341 (+) Transcript_38696:35-1057(+)
MSPWSSALWSTAIAGFCVGTLARAAVFDLDELFEEEWESMAADFRSRVPERLLGTPSTPGKSTRPTPRVGRRHIVHLHVHNAAGTFWCELGRRNGERSSPHMKGNCNMDVPSDKNKRSCHLDGPWWHPKYQTYQCDDRRRQMDERSYTLAMIEREMDYKSGDWCPDLFWYTIILRDPVLRAVTTLEQNEKGDTGRVVEYFHRGLKGKPLTSAWLRSWVAYSDLYVRSLNGPEVMKLPLGALNVSHLDVAKRRLEGFHVILGVPTLFTDYVQAVDVLEWSPAAAPQTRTKKKKKKSTTLELDALLEQHNTWDRQLYEYGMQLAKNRSDALIRACKHTRYCR